MENTNNLLIQGSLYSPQTRDKDGFFRADIMANDDEMTRTFITNLPDTGTHMDNVTVIETNRRTELTGVIYVAHRVQNDINTHYNPVHFIELLYRDSNIIFTN